VPLLTLSRKSFWPPQDVPPIVRRSFPIATMRGSSPSTSAISLSKFLALLSSLEMPALRLSVALIFNDAKCEDESLLPLSRSLNRRILRPPRLCLPLVTRLRLLSPLPCCFDCSSFHLACIPLLTSPGVQIF